MPPELSRAALAASRLFSSRLCRSRKEGMSTIDCKFLAPQIALSRTNSRHATSAADTGGTVAADVCEVATRKAPASDSRLAARAGTLLCATCSATASDADIIASSGLHSTNGPRVFSKSPREQRTRR